MTMENVFGKYKNLSLGLFGLLTFVFAYLALQIEVSSDFKKFLPLNHPYLMNMMNHKEDLTLGNDVRIVVETKSGDIFSEDYLAWIQELTNKIYELPGVDKTFIKTVWTPNSRWIAVTKDGFRGGELIPPAYDGSEASLQEVRQNVLRSSEVGRIVADDFKSTSLFVPLTWQEEGLDYKALNDGLEALRRESEARGYKTYIIGVAKKIGDLMSGAHQMMIFFVAAVLFIFLLLVFYTRSFMVASILTLSGVCGVLWQLGLVSFLGRFINVGLDPYSMLVPFLVFAIAISHGLQLYNEASSKKIAGANDGWDVFFRLRKPASLALGSDAIGFATLAIIPITAIQDLALTASLGVLCLFVTTLIFVPLMISTFGVGQRFIDIAAQRASKVPIWAQFSLFGMKGFGRVIVGCIALGILGFGIVKSQDLKIGDLRAGAPELKADSQYNQDIAYFVEHYSQSVDVYIVLIETPIDECNTPDVLFEIEALQWQLERLPSVQDTFSLADGVKLVSKGLNEGYPKWAHIPLDQVAVNGTTANLPDGFMNLDCSFSPLYVFLKDHKAQTLAEVTEIVIAFDQSLQMRDLKLRTLPAAGNAGIEAAVNESISQQQLLMLLVIYAVVLVMCWLTFRRLSLVVALLLPLGMTSLLCQALMASLDIGVKVSTLPVIALGVGIGVDYGVYICARYLEIKDMSKVLSDTGRIVFFTGITLAISVGSWMFSAIQFQADMGILLTFMFLWNMAGALVLLPFILSLFTRAAIKS